MGYRITDILNQPKKMHMANFKYTKEDLIKMAVQIGFREKNAKYFVAHIEEIGAENFLFDMLKAAYQDGINNSKTKD